MDSKMTNSGAAIVIASGGLSLQDNTGAVITSIIGTKENSECSDRGICNSFDGSCHCFETNGDKYATSDGYGKPGTRGDCGYVISAYHSTVATCPGELQCSGHGYCSDETYECSCFDGWTQGDCSERTCPLGIAWFSYPSNNNVAHTEYVECSNAGICNRVSGECQCRDGFYGKACDLMSCNAETPEKYPDDKPCNGHGVCLTMSQLASTAKKDGLIMGYTYGKDPNNPNTWDSLYIHGCVCDNGYEGFDCSLKSCPHGDDPGTYDDHAEVQLLQCQADNGFFTLSFRDESTTLIPYNATLEYVYNQIQSLSSIRSLPIQVYFTLDELPPNGVFTNEQKPSLPNVANFSLLINNTSTFMPTLLNSTICNAENNSQLVVIYFEGLPGDLPTIQVDTSLLFLADDPGVVNVFSDGKQAYGRDSLGNYHLFSSIQGTTENDVCNNRGLCDYNTGICNCFPTWSSSDGRGQPGYLGDCGYRNQFLET